jgi:ABC-type multidrug transport system fused ATPase/permease subunit
MIESIDVKPRFGKMLAALSHLPRAIALVWGATRSWTIAWASLLLIQGLLPAATVYLTRPLIDSLVAAVNSGGSRNSAFELRTVLWWGGLMAALMLLAEISRELIGWIRRNQSELLQDYIAELNYRQSIAADYAFYDLPEYYDHLHRARTDAAYRPEMLLESLGSLAQSLVTLLAIGAVIISFGWLLPVALLMSALPALMVILYWTLREFDWRKRVTEAVSHLILAQLSSFFYPFSLSLKGLPPIFLVTLAGLTPPPHIAFASLGPQFQIPFTPLSLRLPSAFASFTHSVQIHALSRTAQTVPKSTFEGFTPFFRRIAQAVHQYAFAGFTPFSR